MAAGLPVVSFDCPWGPAEMVEHRQNGLLVPPEDVDELSRAMALLMSDPALRDRLAQTAKSDSRRFEPDRILSQWEEMLLQAAAHRHSGRSEAHTSELQSLMRISYAVFCLKKKKQ